MLMFVEILLQLVLTTCGGFGFGFAGLGRKFSQRFCHVCLCVHNSFKAITITSLLAKQK
jgi:hypothetical protein